MNNILIICKGNSCRSQMAEAFLKQLNPHLNAHSGGIFPSDEVHPLAVKAMQETGIDISKNKTNDIAEFSGHHWDIVMTVCDFAEEHCPADLNQAGRRIHYRFIDPVESKGSEDERMEIFREVRDLIKAKMEEFYQDFFHSSNEKP